MIRYFLTKQFLEFVIVGVLAAFLHWTARIILSQWMPFSGAVIVAYGVGMVVAFVLNSVFVFPKSKKSRTRQARDFVVVNLAFMPIVWSVAVSLVPVFRFLGMADYSQAAAHAVAVAVPTLFTFLIYKFFTFKDTGRGWK